MNEKLSKTANTVGRRGFLGRLAFGAAAVATASATWLVALPQRALRKLPLPRKVTDVAPPAAVQVDAPSPEGAVVVGPGEELLLTESQNLGEIRLEGGTISIEGSGTYRIKSIISDRQQGA
jgi:hypothetical protein